MSYQSRRKLPSLMQPLLTQTQLRTEAYETHVPVPAFPEICQDWDGFFAPHLHLIGTRKDSAIPLRYEQLVLCHELAHGALSIMPFVVNIRLHLLELLSQIRFLGEEHKEAFTSQYEPYYHESLSPDFLKEFDESVVVPLTPDTSGGRMQKRWAQINRLTSEAALIEEVSAVWHSLSLGQAQGLLSNREKEIFKSNYKILYGKGIPVFPAIYDAFEFLADKIGIALINLLTTYALTTFNPTAAFVDLIDYTAHFIMHNPSFPNWPREQVNTFFENFIDAVDIESMRYNHVGAVIYYRNMFRQIEKLGKPIDDYFMRTFLLDDTSKAGVMNLYCTYSDDGLSLSKEQLPEPEQGSIGSYLFKESIRQQLTQGRGLRCPFWDSQRQMCCKYRGNLEMIWKNTTHEPSWRHWQREGCLSG